MLIRHASAVLTGRPAHDGARSAACTKSASSAPASGSLSSSQPSALAVAVVPTGASS